MLRSLNCALVFAMVGVPAAYGQERPGDPAFLVPRYSVSLGFSHMNANAPPGQSDYFGLNGGYVSGDFYFTHWLSIEGEFTGGHANDISLLGQDLTLTTFQAGPKVSLTGHRFVPYGQILFGGAHGSGSYSRPQPLSPLVHRALRSHLEEVSISTSLIGSPFAPWTPTF
jgi:hypothetical protein